MVMGRTRERRAAGPFLLHFRGRQYDPLGQGPLAPLVPGSGLGPEAVHAALRPVRKPAEESASPAAHAHRPVDVLVAGRPPPRCPPYLWGAFMHNLALALEFASLHTLEFGDGRQRLLLQ